MRKMTENHGVLRKILSAGIVLIFILGATVPSFARDSTNSLGGGPGCPLDYGPYALIKKEMSIFSHAFAGDSFTLMNSATDVMGDKITLKSAAWYIDGKIVSTNRTYTIPARYMGKVLRVSMKYSINGGKTLTMAPEKIGSTQAILTGPDKDLMAPGDHTRITKGIIYHKLSVEGFKSKSAVTQYAKGGKVLGVKVTPLAGKVMYETATDAKDHKFRHLSPLKGATIKYQWWIYQGAKKGWVAIPWANQRRYRVPRSFGGCLIGVTFSISKKDYTPGYGFANSLSMSS